MTIDVGPNYRLCSLTMWEARPGYLLARVQHISNLEEMFCDGIPALLKDDGTGFLLLSNTSSYQSRSDPSPRGDFVAFDVEGTPWIYQFAYAVKLFEPKSFGFELSNQMKLIRPAWSNNQQYIAWLVYENAQDKHTQGVGIFDLDNGTSIFFSPYNVCCWEAIQTSVYWSPNNNYLAVYNPVNDTPNDLLWVFSLDGDLVYRDLEHSILYITSTTDFWSPDGTLFSYLRYDEELTSWYVKVVSTGNLETHVFGPAFSIAWSPDGGFIAIGNGGRRDLTGNWLVDTNLWEIIPLDLPEDAIILDWISLD